MKKLVLSVVAAVFAIAAQAGTEKSGTPAASCCSAATSPTKAECSMSGKDSKGCCSMEKTSKTACTKPILKSPKALG